MLHWLVDNNFVHGEVYSIQHYVIKFVCNLRQVGGFLRLLWFPSANAVYTRLWSRGRQVEPPCRLQFGSFLGGSLLVVTQYVAALGWVQLEVSFLLVVFFGPVCGVWSILLWWVSKCCWNWSILWKEWLQIWQVKSGRCRFKLILLFIITTTGSDTSFTT